MTETDEGIATYICARCLVKFRFERWELEHGPAKCVYCNGPLERIGEG